MALISSVKSFSKLTIFILLSSIFYFSICASYPKYAQASEKVVLQLAWKHQFQFAGYYAAQHKGFYKQAGLDVEIVEGGEDKFAREEVLSGNAQYGVAGAELILHRADGEPFVVLAPIFQHSASVLLLRKDSGINSIQGLIGKRVMLLPGKKDADILAAFINEGVSLDSIKRLDQTYNLNDLIVGRTDAVSAYSTNEPWLMKQKGVQPKIITPRTYGVDFYSDCLFSTEEEVEDHPQRVRQFLEASIRGWEYAMSNPQEIIDILLKEYDLQKSRQHLRYEARETKKLMMPDLVQIGHMNPGRWRHIAKIDAKLGMLEPDFSLEGFLYDPNPGINYTSLLWGLGLAILVSAVVGIIAFILFFLNKKLAAEIGVRKKAEEALRESEEHLRTLINATPDIICFKDGQGRWLEANNADLQLFGLTGVDYKLKTDSELANYTLPLYKEAFLNCETTDEKAWKDGRLCREEEIIPLASGEQRVYDVIKSPLFNPDGSRKALVVLGRDISELRQADKEKNKLQAQLLQTQKMESIGRLAGGVAHDLNNMLAAVLGYGDMLLADPELKEGHKKRVELMHQAGQRSRDLVRQLLAFSRKQTLQMQKIDINKVISDVEKFLQQTIRESIDIKFNLSSELPLVQADKTQLEQVILNLTVNAQDAMPEGGKLSIETKLVELDEDYAAHHLDIVQGPYVLLMVSDTGHGITQETREHIFEPFFSTKDIGEGIGLGLSTVYGIVKQHQGHIWVYSEPDKGSVFKIYLPALTEENITEEESEALPEQTLDTRGKETILVVEDDDMVRELTVTVLEEQEYQVIYAANGQQCLEMIKNYQGRIDLLLTDVIMPGLNGKELFEKVLQIFPNIKVIYISGYAENVISSYGILDRGVDFIQKPCNVKDLCAKIREVLDR